MNKITRLIYSNRSYNNTPKVEIIAEEEDGPEIHLEFDVEETVGTQLIQLFREHMLDRLGDMMESLLPGDGELEQAKELAAEHVVEITALDGHEEGS